MTLLGWRYVNAAIAKGLHIDRGTWGHRQYRCCNDMLRHDGHAAAKADWAPDRLAAPRQLVFELLRILGAHWAVVDGLWHADYPRTDDELVAHWIAPFGAR
jgi:hypothetical protein